jgi:hypothetical protein
LCPEVTLAKILDTVGGHPFTLGLMNAAVRVGGMSWTDIEEDCDRGKAANFEQSQERVADRILSRTEHVLGEELSIFRWVDSSRVDRRWFVSVMGNNGEHKLRQHGLVSPDRSGVIRLHDIVLASVKLRTKLDADMDELFTETLNDYIESIAYSDDLAFTSLAFTLAPKLDELVGSGRPGYCLCMASLVGRVRARARSLGRSNGACKSSRGQRHAARCNPGGCRS